MELKHFTESELKLSQQDAFIVLRYLWIEPGLSPEQLTVGDRLFAQALLVEAIDSSYAMGYVEIMFRNFFGQVPTTFSAVRELVQAFAKAAAMHWFKHATSDDLKNPKIYESVRTQFKSNFGSVWRIRLQTGELTY